MNRRTIVAAALGAATLPAVARAGYTSSDVEAVKARLIEWYRAFANPKVDRTYYRSFTTDDYLLCENGELLDKAGDEAMLDTAPPEQHRTDSFDFKQVWVEGDKATLVYFLEARMTDNKHGTRHLRWLESAVVKRNAGAWQFQLLHSTRIEPR